MHSLLMSTCFNSKVIISDFIFRDIINCKQANCIHFALALLHDFNIILYYTYLATLMVAALMVDTVMVVYGKH